MFMCVHTLDVPNSLHSLNTPDDVLTFCLSFCFPVLCAQALSAPLKESSYRLQRLLDKLFDVFTFFHGSLERVHLVSFVVARVEHLKCAMGCMHQFPAIRFCGPSPLQPYTL